MTPNHLSDENLDQKLLSLRKLEREVLVDLLRHLRELDRRRLFSKFGFSSLFDYSIRRLGYSEDQAARRISAMRLLKELPAIEAKIESGALTLTHLSKTQTLFRQEKKTGHVRSVSDKLELLARVEKTSKRAMEKILAEASPTLQEIAKPTPISLEIFSAETQLKLKRLLDVRSHRDPEMNVLRLIDDMAELALEAWDPIRKAERAQQRLNAKETTADPPRSSVANAEHSLTAEVRDSHGRTSNSPAPVRVIRDNIPSAIRHALYLRDGGGCQICRSTRFIEIDHSVPVAKGGTNELQNLRLLCRTCNQRRAIEEYGVSKMDSYLKSPQIAYSA